MRALKYQTTSLLTFRGFPLVSALSKRGALNLNSPTASPNSLPFHFCRPDLTGSGHSQCELSFTSGVRDGRARGCYGVPTREHEEPLASRRLAHGAPLVRQ